MKMNNFEKLSLKSMDITGKEVLKMDAAAYMESGNEKWENGDREGAIDDFTKAIEIEPNNHSIYYWRARVKVELHDYFGSIDDYSKAIEKCIDKSYFLDYYCSRGHAKTEMNDDEGAIQDYLKAIDIAPDYFLPYAWLGKIYCKRKDYSKAVEYLDQCVKVIHNEDDFRMSEYLNQDYSEEEWNELVKYKTNIINK